MTDDPTADDPTADDPTLDETRPDGAGPDEPGRGETGREPGDWRDDPLLRDPIVTGEGASWRPYDEVADPDPEPETPPWAPERRQVVVRPRRFDPVSFVAGVVFLFAATAFAADHHGTFDVPVRWIVPTVLVALGIALFIAARPRRHDPTW